MYTKKLRRAATVFAVLLAMGYTIWDARSTGAAAARTTATVTVLVSIYFALEEVCQILKDMRAGLNGQIIKDQPTTLSPR
jgi:hypothetical protein